MTKQKHLHALLATIHVALEYSPDDLESLPTISTQLREQARKLTGYRDIEIRLGKIPAPVVTEVTQSPPDDAEKPPVMPGFLKRG